MDNLKTVILYTREGCHLCHQAQALLERHGLRPQLVDIDDDPRLQREYGTIIPVVSIDGVVRFRGQVNEVLLKRLIQ